jgi:hypothetical protein
MTQMGNRLVTVLSKLLNLLLKELLVLVVMAPDAELVDAAANADEVIFIAHVSLYLHVLLILLA